mgnify:CR=1 FL=1
MYMQSLAAELERQNREIRVCIHCGNSRVSDLLRHTAYGQNRISCRSGKGCNA